MEANTQKVVIKKKCDNSLEPLIPIPPKSLMIKDVIISVIAGVADDRFRTGWSGPTDPRFPDTPLPRDMSWQPVSASPRGKRKIPPSNRPGTETGGEGLLGVRVVWPPRTPSPVSRNKKKMPGEGFGNWVPSPSSFFVLYWLAEVARVSQHREVSHRWYHPLHHE